MTIQTSALIRQNTSSAPSYNLDEVEDSLIGHFNPPQNKTKRKGDPRYQLRVFVQAMLTVLDEITCIPEVEMPSVGAMKYQIQKRPFGAHLAPRWERWWSGNAR